MKKEFYSQNTKKLLFTVFDSVKEKKRNIYRTHQHPDLELGFITTGHGRYILNGEIYSASEGGLFLVRPNEQHCVPTIETQVLSSINIHITSYFIWNYCGKFIDPSYLYLLMGSGSDEHIERKFDGLGEDILKLFNLCNDGKDFDARMIVLKILFEITETFCTKCSENKCLSGFLSYRDDVQNAICFMNEHLNENISLSDIAKSVGYSTSHFSAVFKSLTGVAPYEYLVLQRIERAVELLKTTCMTVGEISDSCGFRNLSNFNRLFLKVCGLTPSGYRASLNK